MTREELYNLLLIRRIDELKEVSRMSPETEEGMGAKISCLNTIANQLKVQKIDVGTTDNVMFPITIEEKLKRHSPGYPGTDWEELNFRDTWADHQELNRLLRAGVKYERRLYCVLKLKAELYDAVEETIQQCNFKLLEMCKPQTLGEIEKEK